MPRTIQYSEKYQDDIYEYRHVILPTDIARLCPKNKLLSETEWRQLGVQQSRGWEHYAVHKPEPHILLFRRPMGTDPVSGKVPDGWKPRTDIAADAGGQQALGVH